MLHAESRGGNVPATYCPPVTLGRGAEPTRFARPHRRSSPVPAPSAPANAAPIIPASNRRRRAMLKASIREYSKLLRCPARMVAVTELAQLLALASTLLARDAKRRRRARQAAMKIARLRC